VFVDGAPARFTVDVEGAVVLPDDPAGKLVEVTTRTRWLTVAASGVTVAGFRMRHSAGGDDHALAVFAPAYRATIRDNVLQDAGAYAVMLEGDDHRFEGNDVSGAHGVAVHLGTGRGIRVRGNRIHDSGPQLPTGPAPWRPAGLLGWDTQAVIEDNEVHDNRGAGLFFQRSAGVELRGNSVHGNAGAGIVFLHGERADIEKNRLWRNGWRMTPTQAGIFVTSSNGVTVRWNTLAYQPSGVEVGPARSTPLTADFDPCSRAARNLIEGNVLVDSGAVGLTGDPRESGTIAPCASTQSVGNRLWRRGSPAAAPGPVPANPRDAYISERERDELIAAARIPATASP
jgi:parallel beta-helix repeat protein